MTCPAPCLGSLPYREFAECGQAGRNIQPGRGHLEPVEGKDRMEGRRPMKIIVGVDDSVYSNAAIRHIMDTSWPKSARFTVISAVAWPVVSGAGEILSTTAVKDILADQEKHHREIADRAAAELRQAGLSAEARMIRGDPRFVLEEEARKESADLIVVGTYGWTGVKKLLLGSVASHVVTHAPCSVLVVRKTP